MKRLWVAGILVVSACGMSPSGSGTTVTTSPVATTPVTTTPVTTSPVTTTPIGGGTAPPGTEATVLAVLDGDSLRVASAQGEDEVRLIGIDAPERDECLADRARDLLTVAVGERVVLVGDTRDRHGRLLANAYVGSSDVGTWLLTEGVVIAITTAHPLLDEYLAAESDAVLRGVGLWAPDACGPLPFSGPFIASLEPDAPGRDEENPNGEFVVIGNDGPDRDLGEWRMRDESSTHRYTFPDGFVLASGGFVTLRSGCGTDTASELFWCADGAVWNNEGDTALLIGPDGSFVSRMRYLGD